MSERPKAPAQRLLAELERIIARRERRSAENERRRMNAVADIFNESLAEAIEDEAMRLRQKLTDIGILGNRVQGDVFLSRGRMPFEWWVRRLSMAARRGFTAGTEWMASSSPGCGRTVAASRHCSMSTGCRLSGTSATSGLAGGLAARN